MTEPGNECLTEFYIGGYDYESSAEERTCTRSDADGCAIPVPGPGEVLIKVKTTAICGTDHHIYIWNEWSQNRIKPPQIMGHELAGDC